MGEKNQCLASIWRRVLLDPDRQRMGSTASHIFQDIKQYKFGLNIAKKGFIGTRLKALILMITQGSEML